MRRSLLALVEYLAAANVVRLRFGQRPKSMLSERLPGRNICRRLARFFKNDRGAQRSIDRTTFLEQISARLKRDAASTMLAEIHNGARLVSVTGAELLEPFTPENGLLTTTGKIRRAAIAERFAAAIEILYRKTP